jgi:hypothetical protein
MNFKDTMNSKLRSDNENELVIAIQDGAVKSHRWMTCLNCLYWHRNNTSAGDEGCDKFSAMPPPHIIVSGCKDHEFDIPF